MARRFSDKTDILQSAIVGWARCLLGGLVLVIAVCDYSLAEARRFDLACDFDTPAEQPSGRLVDPSGAIRPLDADNVIENAVVVELLTWIEAHTDYDVSASLAEPPSIGFCRHGDVIDYEGQSLNVDPDLGGAYDMERRHIYLAQPWDASNVRNLGTLLHELIHDVQYRNRDWPCWQKTEWEAYKLQESWLAEKGLSAGFDWALILMLSHCPQGHHP